MQTSAFGFLSQLSDGVDFRYRVHPEESLGTESENLPIEMSEVLILTRKEVESCLSMKRTIEAVREVL